MKRTFVIAAIFANLSYAASAKMINNYVNGNSLLSYCTTPIAATSAFCSGYTQGIADALGGSTVNGFRACIPAGVQGAQLKDIAIDFLRAHAANRHSGAAGLVSAAFAEAFPCP
jgi:hypothetical protein